jgi:plasmid replication initiation protein
MTATHPYKQSPVITQGNALVEASYRLNLEEKRLIIAAIAKIDSRKEVPAAITITAEEYAELFDLDVNAAYTQLIDASSRLFERTITNLKGDDNTQRRKRTRWIYDEEVYKKGEGKVVIRFSPNLFPYLGMLKEQFTGYRLSSVKALKSAYSIRLYELLTQYLSAGERWITVEQFRDMLDVQDKYPRFADLKRWIIEPAVQELNNKSNYDVLYRTERKGRAVHKIWFFFNEKEQMQLDF